MPGTPGPRTGLAQILSSGENPTILRTGINAVISWLEGNAAITAFGTLATRPPSTPGTPGIAGRRYRATDAFATFRDTGTGWELEAQTPQVVTALPTPGGGIPFDGQEILYVANVAAGVVWHLRYNAADTSPYKWQVLGARPLIASTITSVTGPTSTPYAAFGTALTLTLPLAGDYDIQTGGMGVASTPTANYLSYDVGVTGALDADAARSDNTIGASVWSPLRRKTITTAGTVLTSKGRRAAGTSTWENREIVATPVRVG